jgi:V/A-type H+-transporting ATPase subunit F
MRYYVIGDEDTVIGFRFAGIPGDIVQTAEEARKALARAEKDPEIAVVIMTDVIADTIRPEVNRVRFHGVVPLLVEVPGPGGPSPKRRALLSLIREAVGVRV